MIANKLRIGNPTSSGIVALTSMNRKGDGPGAPFQTYVDEKNMERKLGRSLDTETNARALVWGKLLEGRVFEEILGLEYTLNSQETMQHPTIHFWTGSPDGFKYDHGKTVVDIKAPITLKSFCQLVDPLYDGMNGIEAMNVVRSTHKDGDKYYWQLVSNSVLSESKFAELIVYVPFQDELDEIKRLADGVAHCMWIQFADELELPFIKRGGHYSNRNIIRFEVPEEDKEFLTQRVLLAGEKLIDVEKPSLVYKPKTIIPELIKI